MAESEYPGPDLPPLPLPSVFTAVLEVALNRWLDAAPEAERGRLAGRAIAVEIRPPGLGLVFLGAADRLQVLGSLDDETPDVLLRGSPVSLAAALRGDRSGVEIEGDGAVLGDLQRALEAVSVDWAEWFESVAGAGTAGPLLAGLDALRDQFQRFTRRGFEDIGDYMQEEARFLPASGEFEAWTADIADLRDDVARLEARIQLLEADRGPDSGDPSGASDSG
jgi:ubiquinone biosynthesis protein UbiJ